MAGSSEDDRRRQVARFKRQSKHFLTHEEELLRKQQVKAREAGNLQRRPKRRRPVDDEDPVEFEKISARTPIRVAIAPAAIEPLPRGTVTAVHAGRIEVDGAPARLSASMVTDPEQRLAVGDEVAFELTAGPPRVVARLPRRSRLARPDPGNAHRDLVLAANVDIAVIVVAAADPPLRPGLIDRFLLALQRGGVAPLLCVNKVDLLDERGRAELLATLRPYEELAVPMVLCSANTGAGTEALRELVRGRTCVFAGHSGVGKSSLLNALDQGRRATGDVREYDGKGRHTTTSSSLRQLADGTRVIDTPGIRSLGLEELSRDELRAAFPDLQAFAGGCRFGDCSHTHEPDCAVRAAVAAGRLSAIRLSSWRRLASGDDP